MAAKVEHLVGLAAVVIAICLVPAALVSISQLGCIYGSDDWDGAFKLSNHQERLNWCLGSSPVTAKASNSRMSIYSRFKKHQQILN